MLGHLHARLEELDASELNLMGGSRGGTVPPSAAESLALNVELCRWLSLLTSLKVRWGVVGERGMERDEGEVRAGARSVRLCRWLSLLTSPKPLAMWCGRGPPRPCQDAWDPGVWGHAPGAA